MSRDLNWQVIKNMNGANRGTNAPVWNRKTKPIQQLKDVLR